MNKKPMPDLPPISLITPSFNQAPFLEATLRSVHEQAYPRLQHLVIDGGSTDGSRDILEHWRPVIERAGGRVIIERDRGQTDAINKGLRLATGEVVGWLCSDDLLLPGALHRIGENFASRSGVDWVVGGCTVIDTAGQTQYAIEPRGDFSLEGLLLRGDDRPFELPQPGAYWRRSLHDELGLLREDLHYCMDFEWWLRLVRSGRSPLLTPEPLAAYRLHETSKSCAQSSGFIREHLVVEREYAAGLPWRARLAVMRRLGYMRRAYELSQAQGRPWKVVARRPWWIVSQQVRAALRQAA